MIDNQYKVPKKMWIKWGDHERALFNGLYGNLLRLGPDLMFNSDTLKNYDMPKEEFQTIAWNAAFLAADQSMRVDLSGSSPLAEVQAQGQA